MRVWDRATKRDFGCKIKRRCGALDVDVAQQMGADVAAYVELFDSPVPEHEKSDGLACAAALRSLLISL